MDRICAWVAGGILGVLLCGGVQPAGADTYEEWQYHHKTRVLAPQSGAVVPLDADLHIQIEPFPGATHYGCRLYQHIKKGDKTHEWANNGCGGPGCYPPSTTPSCVISASDLAGNFEAGAATIMVWAGRDFPTESGLHRYSFGEDSEKLEITFSPGAGAAAGPASPLDAPYEPRFVDRSPDSPFRCNGDPNAKVYVKGGRFSFYVYFDNFGKTEDYKEVPPAARVRIDGVIQQNGTVGPVAVPLTPANLAAVQRLGGAGYKSLTVTGWFRKMNSAKDGTGRKGRISVLAPGGTVVGKRVKKGCAFYSLRAPEYEPGDDEMAEADRTNPPPSGARAKRPSGYTCIRDHQCESGVCLKTRKNMNRCQ